MNFLKAQKSYDQNAVVQKEMAKKIFRVIENFSQSPFKMLEIGSGTGFLTEYLMGMVAQCGGEIFLNDINPNQTKFCDTPFIQGDITDVKIPNDLDLIASNAVFQWVSDLDLLFSKLHASLKTNGVIAFSTFGPQNYKQFIPMSFTLNYPALAQIEDMLKENFKILHLEEDFSTLYFNSPIDVLSHIKATGVSTFSPSGLWTANMLKKFEEDYIDKNSDPNGVELTYHSVYVCAKKL